MKILVTGAAGFIGSRLVQLLSKRGDAVVGLDNINDYYDTRLKMGRLENCGIECGKEKDFPWHQMVQSTLYPNYRFVRAAIDDVASLKLLFEQEQFDCVVNLAAQAGVRYSITHPYSYLQSNLIGFFNVLECCRMHKVGHLVFASSSSVYGLNEKVPFEETDRVDSPVSLYAATKKSNELMAHSYSKLYGIPVSGLRYFTVYGPWGRPDMAPMLFAKAISRGEVIRVFNNGNLSRDFTYIDDIIEGILRVIDHIPTSNQDWSAQNPDPSSSTAPYKIYNIGNSHPVKLMDFIQAIEGAIGHPAEKIYLPMQPGDVYQTNADTSALQNELGFKPDKPIKEGVQETIDWYRSFYQL